MAKKDKTSSISVQKIAVLAIIISALVGGLSGYLVSLLQTDALISMKKDDIAHSLAKADLEQMARLGISSDYSPISHYAVHRRILEDFDVSKQVSTEEVRDRVEAAFQACRAGREKILMLSIAQSDHLHLKEAIKYMRDDIEEYDTHIASIPNTPEGNKYKKILRKYAEVEMQRLDILEAMHDEQKANRVQDLLLGAIKEASEKNEGLQKNR